MDQLKTPLWVIATATTILAAVHLLVVVYVVSQYLALKYGINEALQCWQGNWDYC